MEVFPLEKLLAITDKSLFKLVLVVSKRAIEIAEGSPKLCDVSPSVKPASVALQEIVEGRLKCKFSKGKK
ncbi:MAG TPA: DNA-directed RNA polymerase subunit omega [Candidatus Omnitrophica bacterium]|nr:DNA-directed RNA polymerase subunit omega [Candidatus Omnitrophota bacterium]